VAGQSSRVLPEFVSPDILVTVHILETGSSGGMLRPVELPSGSPALQHQLAFRTASRISVDCVESLASSPDQNSIGGPAGT
jgi:hypothetical protein